MSHWIHNSWEDSPWLDLASLINYGDNLIGIVTGFGSVDGTCDAILEAEDRGDRAVQDLQVLLRDRGLGLISNIERCTLFVASAFDALNDIITDSSSSSSFSWMSSGHEEHNFEPTFEYITGFDDYNDFCEVLVAAMTQEAVEKCRGLVDCAGVCNGDAKPDCSGICNGPTVVDCAGECDGTATTNQCNECIGGRTGRLQSFGMDQCELCKRAVGYKETWDCAGTCDGTAFFDRCGECVGGQSGKTSNHNLLRFDCRGICDGVWVEDTCGFCEPAPVVGVSYTGGSKYMDCSLTCITPGMSGAFENPCGECVGGETSLDYEYGLNECGQCESAWYADTSSCEGCDGVTNSGKEYDACGLCGGDGTDCIGVGKIFPNFIPANQDISLRVEGAGFTTGSTLTCVFTSSRGGSFNGEVTKHSSVTSLSCTANLDTGSYTVQIRRGSDIPTDITANLEVYDDVPIESISPVQVEIDPGVELEVSIIATVQSGSDLNAIRAVSNVDYDVNPSILLAREDGGRIAFPGVFTSDTQITATVPVPVDSVRLDAVVSVNGVHGLATASGEPFTLAAYYPAPQMQHIQFTSNGAGLTIGFSDEVHYEDFESCADIFENANRLGTNAECKWRGPKTLFVLFGKGNNLLEIDDAMTLKEGAVKAFRQEFSLAADGSAIINAPESALQPKAILSGSERIPSCGDIDMDGRTSTGSGARALMFQWSVTSLGSTTNVDAELSALNSMDGGNGSPVLSVSGSLIDADTDYIFQLTVTNFLGQSDSTSLTVYRSAVLAPQVKVFAEGADIETVKISESFHLTALVTFYSACVPPGETLFEWSTNNADVALNLKTMYSRSLHVPTKSLPGGEVIEFSVKVYKSSDPASFVSTPILVTTAKSDLVARIKGGDEFTVGRDGGIVQLDGSLSFDPDEEARDWVYEWQCVQIDDNSACWSFDPANIGSLVVDSWDSNMDIIEFDALALEADKIYQLTLIVSKEDRSASAVVYISAVNGNPPKVEVQPVSNTGEVKDDDNINIIAFIYHSVSSEVANATWISTDTDLGYGFVDIEDSSNLVITPQLIKADPGFIVSLFAIRKGVLERGTEYSFSGTVYQDDGQSSSAKMSFSVLSGPTSCDLSIDDYQELTEVEISTENCVTSDDAYPLSYQLFVLNEEGNLEAVTETKSDPTFSILGKAKIEGSSTRDYTVKVCDKNEICSTYSASCTVTQKEELSEEEKFEFRDEHITPLKYSGDYVGALINLNELLSFTSANSAKRRRRRDVVETSTDDVTEQLELILLTIDSSVLTTSSAQTLLDQANSVNTADMSLSDQSDYTSYIATIVQVFIDDDTAIPTSSSQSILEKLTEIRANLDPTYNANMLTSIESLQNTLMSSQASDLALGEAPQVTTLSDVTTSVAKVLLSGTFTTSSSGTAATIDFGSQLESMYGGAWSCSSGTCSGITVIFLHYSDEVDYLSTTDDDKNARASSIIEIQLADPDSGDEIDVTGLTDPITMTIPLTNGQSDVTYECRYWNTTQGVWSEDSVATGSVSSTDVQCQSYHLTAFAVFAVPDAVIEEQEENSSTTSAPVIEDPKDGILFYILIFGGVAVLLLLVIIVLIVLILKRPRKSVDEENGSREAHVPPPKQQDQESPAHQPAPVQHPASLTQQQLPQIHMVLQPIIIQQPYPTTLPPPSNNISSPPPAYHTLPVIDGNQPVLTLVSSTGELTSSKLPDEMVVTSTAGGKKHSESYSSYVQACTGGMAPVVEPTIPPPTSYTPPSEGVSDSVAGGSNITISTGSKASLTGHY